MNSSFFKKDQFLRLTRILTVAVLLATSSFTYAGLNQNGVSALAATTAQFQEKTHKTNILLEGWQKNEDKYLDSYLLRRGLPGGPNEDFDIVAENKNVKMKPMTADEIARDLATSQLVETYYGSQGLNRYFGTFVESGAAYSDGYQWNTQRWAGFENKTLRDQFLDQCLKNGLLNIRIGINIHEVDTKKPESIARILDFHREAWQRGISITDSVLFFSGLKNMETLGHDGQVDPTRSYQNNPRFPEYSEQVAEFVLKAIFKEQRKFNLENSKKSIGEKKATAHTAVNPVNEPETFAGFNNFWNGGFANWSNPNVMQLYVPTIINIAKASVRIRMATERAANGERILFFHNEAMTPPNYPSHQGDLQFGVSKFILGDAQLMKADFNRLETESLDVIQAGFEKNKQKGLLNAVEAAVLKYSLIPANDTNQKKENARLSIVKQLRELRDLHLAYQKMTEVKKDGRIVTPGKTAKTDTIAMFDYYQQSEFLLPKSVPQMIQELSANNGAALKKVLDVKEDISVLSALEFRAHQAEGVVQQKLWPSDFKLKTADIQKLLTAEDAIVLDKLVGLRNDWHFKNDPVYVARRERADLNPSKVYCNDENRADEFLANILKDDARILKSALLVHSNADLLKALKKEGANAKLGSLRDILNDSERKVLHNVFGLERTRQVGFLPPHYARQTRAEMRKGFYETFLIYVNELGMHVGGIGESGTPYYPWASLVHKQMMLSLVAAAKHANFVIVRNDIGPAIGTIGWMSGPMTGNLETNGRRGEDGIFKMVPTSPDQYEYKLSAWGDGPSWFLSFKEDVIQGLRKQQQLIAPSPLKEAAY